MDKHQTDPAIGKPVDKLETEEAGGWRPIATAPKDGTPIDIWCMSDDRVDQWRETSVIWHEPRAMWVNTRGVWDCATHWMPLPLSPSDPARLTPSDEGTPIGSATPSSLSSCARSEAQRIREDRWALACQMAVEIEIGVSQGADLSVELAQVFCGLLQRSEEAREEKVELDAGLKMWHAKFLAMAETYLSMEAALAELRSAVTSSDLDHASVVLVARANAQDSELVETLQDTITAAKTLLWTTDGLVIPNELTLLEMVSALLGELAAAEQTIGELQSNRDFWREVEQGWHQQRDALTAALAAVRQEVDVLERRWRKEVAGGEASWSAAVKLECAEQLAAARLRATTQEQDDLTRSGRVDVEPPPQPAATDTKG